MKKITSVAVAVLAGAILSTGVASADVIDTNSTATPVTVAVVNDTTISTTIPPRCHWPHYRLVRDLNGRWRCQFSPAVGRHRHHGPNHHHHHHHHHNHR